MADDNNDKAKKGAPLWVLFALPAVLAAIGAYLALTRPAPNAAQDAINVKAGLPSARVESSAPGSIP